MPVHHLSEWWVFGESDEQDKRMPLFGPCSMFLAKGRNWLGGRRCARIEGIRFEICLFGDGGVQPRQQFNPQLFFARHPFKTEKILLLCQFL